MNILKRDESLITHHESLIPESLNRGILASVKRPAVGCRARFNDSGFEISE